MAEVTNTLGHDDAEYRRGTVLGLTVAEIFILLLFLLLLVLLSLSRDWQELRGETDDLTETKKKLADAESRLQPLLPWEPIAQEFKTPDEVVTLQRRQAEIERENQALLAEVEEQRTRAQTAERRAQQVVSELDILRRKGENPPCWYERMLDDDGELVREKPYYTFNIGVFDEHMIILPAETPPGAATDDNGPPYAEEAKRLRLADIPYGTPLDNQSFITHMKPIHDAGENLEVRSYSCIFWARVWDNTAPDAKARWKYAHDGIIEGMFGAYTVRDDPWPGEL